MSFTIKIRGSSSAPIVSEYICPTHGRFDVIVYRNEVGDPPPVQPCMVRVGECEQPCDWVISGPRGRVKLGEAGSRGKTEPPPPGYMDTRALGEGQSLDEWRAERAKQRAQQREREIAEVMKP